MNMQCIEGSEPPTKDLKNLNIAIIDGALPLMFLFQLI